MLKRLQDPQLLRAFSTSQQALPGFMLPVVVCWSDFVGEENWGGGCFPPFSFTKFTWLQSKPVWAAEPRQHVDIS